jgi:hypothetical protein
MGIRRVFVSLAASAILTVQLGAQAKPSYAGRWTSDPDPATAPPAGQRGGGGGGGGGGRADMGSGWGANFTITQDAGRMTVEIPFFSRGDMQPPLRFAYALDGTETKNTVMMGRGIQSETSKTAWEGEKLIITTMHQIQNPADGKPMAMEVRRTLSLDAASLVVETLRKGILGGPDTTTRTVYRRAGG